jgi:chorismate mutase
METLEEIRKETRKIDEEIISLIAKRTKLGEKAFELKKLQRAEIYDEKHIQEVLKMAEDAAEREGLDRNSMKKIFELMVKMRMEKQLKKMME